MTELYQRITRQVFIEYSYPVAHPRELSRHEPQNNKDIRNDKNGDKAANDTTPLVCMDVESRLAEGRRLRRRHDAEDKA